MLHPVALIRSSFHNVTSLYLHAPINTIYIEIVSYRHTHNDVARTDTSCVFVEDGKSMNVSENVYYANIYTSHAVVWVVCYTNIPYMPFSLFHMCSSALPHMEMYSSVAFEGIERFIQLTF